MASKNKKTERKFQFIKPKINSIHIISLTILIGMIVSAIIIIRDVNEEYKIRQIAGEFQKYKYAYLSFNNVYNGIPGDLENATFYWPEKTGNGNGDRKITHGAKEGVLAWQHLQLSKLIKETGFLGDWPEGQIGVLKAGFNVPKGLFENSVYYFNFDEDLVNNVIIFAVTNGTSGVANNAVLSPSEAYKLDLIIDDGMPSTGNIISRETTEGECLVAGEYKLLNGTKECISIFQI